MRTCARSKGFALAAIVVLALGIGVNTASFSIVNAIFFRPLPAFEPGRLAYLYHVRTGVESTLESREVEFLRENSDTFSDVTTHWAVQARLAADGEAESIHGEAVTANYFGLLGIKPLLGNVFRSEDDQPATTTLAVVISHGLWTRRFHGDPAIIGKDVRLDDRIFRIVGVAPAVFKGVSDPWTPNEFSG